MDKDSSAARALRALTYGISSTTDAHALNKVDDAFRLIDQRATGLSPPEFLKAVREALACSDNLAELIGLDLSDPIIREYLRRVEQRLAPRVEAGER